MDQETLQKYIEGKATTEEKEAVAHWLDADERNMKEFLSLRKLYDITIWQQEVAPTVIRNIIPLAKKQAIRSFAFELLKIAAIFLIAFSLFRYLYEPILPEPIMQTIQVPAGQRAELTLSDGTKVWLNAKTTLIFPNNFTSKSREVILNGEGYFDVAKYAAKPFIVKTDQHEIKALGTEFNVIAYTGSPLFETALLKGAVNVYSVNTDKAITLEPNTRVLLKNGILEKGLIEHTNYFLWREGLMCFYDETVDNMINKLQLYFDVKIEVKNKELLSNRYSGKFRTKDGVLHVLKVLQLNNKFTFKKDDDLNIITIR